MIKKHSNNIWDIPKTGSMRVPGRIFASKKLLSSIEQGDVLKQIKNVAALPGIVGASLAMPDAHQGYGFPIGGVAAFDNKTGIISPGGVGYDINCGVRLLISDIDVTDFLPHRAEIIKELARAIPSGVGETSDFKLDDAELDDVLRNGIAWAVGKKYATSQDQRMIEDNGRLVGADPAFVSPRARARGRTQLGTLGSGNHFLEIQQVDTIFNARVAKAFGITHTGQIACMIHCGSRGLGHQIASDYIQKMEEAYGFEHLPDRELACAPLDSVLGKEYFAAMCAAANFAFVNRQLISFQTRKVFSSFFRKMSLDLVYDIAHNIAKYETLRYGGKKQRLCVHRKGATRSFGPGRSELPTAYRSLGSPILLPGSMGTASYVLVGTREAEELTCASTAHGAGRVLSRSHALATISKADVDRVLKKQNVLLHARSSKGAVEEAPEVYKDIDEVARVSDELGIGNLVARLKPIAVMKG